MKANEMVTILEAIIRDESTNPTARCTAIRTLRQIEQDRAGGRSDELDDELERLLHVTPVERISSGATPTPNALTDHSASSSPKSARGRSCRLAGRVDRRLLAVPDWDERRP